ncbi:HipA family kinase [Thalassoroseus pseudoceratinae]|uniref:HipA family kinase n=1 Tax=Thalassoroseus pseudoceratinae TaxID=2713176 RepID=UPI0014215261|nr:HipA family kinase [Thalassoroseus pseudoceratinae]
MSSGNPADDLAPAWPPTTFVRFEEGLDTSMGTARIVTDAGRAYIKAMGNRQGPHPLACEVVATRLAAWFGLPTLEHSILDIDAEFDEIPYVRGGVAATGPAFVTKAITGHPWGGSEKELVNLVNQCDVGRLVVFDTWVRNCDRHPPDSEARKPNYDNVFLEDLREDDSGKTRLMAIDHTHCFTCGRDLNSGVANIGNVKDERLYGLFPGFRNLVLQEDVEAAIAKLNELNVETVRPIAEDLPNEWEVDDRAKDALIDLIVRRADFVAGIILGLIARQCWPSRLFGNC